MEKSINSNGSETGTEGSEPIDLTRINSTESMSEKNNHFDTNQLNCPEISNIKRPKFKGKNKIDIEFITKKSRRQSTFSKRKTGLMKKAYELAELTGAEVLLMIASDTNHVYTYGTTKMKPVFESEQGKLLIEACLNSNVVGVNSGAKNNCGNNGINDGIPMVDQLEHGNRIDSVENHHDDDDEDDVGDIFSAANVNNGHITNRNGGGHFVFNVENSAVVSGRDSHKLLFPISISNGNVSSLSSSSSMATTFNNHHHHREIISHSNNILFPAANKVSSETFGSAPDATTVLVPVNLASISPVLPPKN